MAQRERLKRERLLYLPQTPSPGSISQRPKTKCARVPVTKARFLKALRGTFGIRGRIAHRLQCRRETVIHLLQRPDWEDVRQAVKQEEEFVLDTAESTLFYCMKQRDDLKIASANAKWLLGRKAIKRGYGEKQRVTLEGGKRPIRTEATIPITALDLPLELRRQLLEAMNKYEADQRKQAVTGKES